MIFIKEFLANPIGPDKGEEYIGLFNSGEVAVSLDGWRVADAGGKSFPLTGYVIPSQTELRLFSSATKITLNNSNETVVLFNASGAQVDELVLVGSAREGEPFQRVSEIDSEIRARFFDNWATTSLESSARSFSGELVLFWLPLAIIMALAAVLVMRSIKESEEAF